MSTANILLVEDEQIASMDIREMIEESGYAVAATSDSAESAIEAAEEHNPDLVIMDINLPGERDGIDAAVEIQSRHDLPVIYLTAFSDEETLKRARKTEPSGFLVKPVTRADIQATVEMTLGNNNR